MFLILITYSNNKVWLDNKELGNRQTQKQENIDTSKIK